MNSAPGRYFIRLLTLSVAATIVAVAGLFFVLYLLDNLGRQDTGSAVDDLRDTLLAMPSVLVAALPACCGIGCAVGLAVMDGRTEIALLRITGAGRRTLHGWIATASVAWIAAFLVLTELVLPETAEISREIEIRRGGSLLTADEEVWLKTSEGFAMIGAISADGGEVGDLWTFSGRDGGIDTVTQSPSAAHEGGAWTREGVSRAELADDGNWDFSDAPSERWEAGPDPELLRAFTIRPDSLPLGRLFSLSESMRGVNQNTVVIDMVIWSRIFDAASIAVLMLAGFLLVRHRTKESATSARATAMAALVAMILYYYLQVIVRQHAVDANWPAVVGAALPPVAFALLTMPVLALRRLP